MNINIETIEEIIKAIESIEENKSYNDIPNLIKSLKEYEKTDILYRDKYFNLIQEYEELEAQCEEQSEEILYMREHNNND